MATTFLFTGSVDMRGAGDNAIGVILYPVRRRNDDGGYHRVDGDQDVFI